MKSNEERSPVTFQVIQERLIDFVVWKVNNGDFTERGLARIIGVSQPQIHNVLKGKRRLLPGLADVIMSKFEIDILDLLTDAELRARLVGGVLRTRTSQLLDLSVERKGPGRERSKHSVLDDLLESENS